MSGQERLIEELQLRVQELESHVATLDRHLGGTALYCRTLLQVMLDRDMVTPERFRELFDQLDLLDGVKDGR